jgi:tellurite methyltransferase
MGNISLNRLLLQKMSDPDVLLKRWNQRHGDPTHHPQSAEVLSQHRHLLPAHGRALDLACGLGGNALLMAQAGLDVTAWDLSPVAIERLKAFAVAKGLWNLKAEARDLSQTPPPSNSFDVIVVSYFLERELIPSLVASLRQGGLIFYQTFTKVAVTENGPTNPDYRLADNELLKLFSPLKTRFYQEENLLGNLSEGMRDVAMLVAEKV